MADASDDAMPAGCETEFYQHNAIPCRSDVATSLYLEFDNFLLAAANCSGLHEVLEFCGNQF